MSTLTMMSLDRYSFVHVTASFFVGSVTHFACSTCHREGTSSRSEEDLSRTFLSWVRTYGDSVFICLSGMATSHGPPDFRVRVSATENKVLRLTFGLNGKHLFSSGAIPEFGRTSQRKHFWAEVYNRLFNRSSQATPSACEDRRFVSLSTANSSCPEPLNSTHSTMTSRTLFSKTN